MDVSEPLLRSAVKALEPRVHTIRSAPPRPSGRYVLYWCTTALRADENHALERALVAAHKLEQPLVVYHGLSARYAHANDRITGFVLEGELSLRPAFEARGARYVFALDRGRERTRWLDRVAADASVVITDDFPVYDVRRWVLRFAERFDGPVLAVDSACVVPMRSVGRAYERAFAFRQRVREVWPSAIRALEELPPPRPLSPALAATFDDIDTIVRREDVASILASLPIDHSIARSRALEGGVAAARARWQRFLDGPIDEYSARRNDALDDDGVSLMSPYLHWGMIAATKLAREARARRGESVEKWVDELLVWRELAWSFCAHNPGYDDVERAVPQWALRSLRDRPRPMFAPTELAMELGETGDALWDAAQRRLRRDGYLHNNLRMTWGKQIVAWLHDPARALAVLESLNHRFALDGRDPNSYGGLLWCLGQFDRPHPRTDAWGTTRPRETRVHARRLDAVAYGSKRVGARTRVRRVVVIGAGLAGVQCARMLHEHGVDVQVLEKSRAIGGRLASRRVDGHPFAHGAPVLHHTLPFFERLLALLVDDGLLIRLDTDRVRALGPMTEWVRRLARPIDERIAFETQAVRLERSGRGWVVYDERAQSWSCDAVVLAMPTTQAAVLAQTALSWIDERALAALERARYEPTLVVMALFEPSGAIETPFEDSLVDHAILRRCVVERVERGGRPCVAATLYAQPSFSAAHEHEGDDGPWTRAMIDAAREVLSLGVLLAQDSKRWRYARVIDERACDDGSAFLSLDRDGTLLAIGDGVADRAQGRDAEASWTSASAAASALVQRCDGAT